MKEITVLNVTNWVGYRLTEYLLNQGYLVKGTKDREGLEHLGDFFERNSNFEWISEKNVEERYELGVCAFNPPVMNSCDFNQLFIINGEVDEKENRTIVHAPLLFGEWMPIEKEDRLRKNLKEGIYIEDFLEVFVPLLENPPEDSEIHFQSERKKEEKKLEKYLLVPENNPIEEKINDVITHYERFKELYPEN